jgi:acetyltransferase EpsM
LDLSLPIAARKDSTRSDRVVKPERLVIWGTSGHALVASDIVKLSKQYQVAAYIDDNESRWGQRFGRNVICGGRGQLASLLKKGISVIFVAIGDCAARTRVASFAQQKGFKLATLIHPRAILSPEALIGPGSLIAAGAVIGPGVRIGENVIVNTVASVGHECILGDGVHVGPGTHLGGEVKIGRTTWVGLGCNLKNQITLGANCIVGAGSLVLKDLPDDVLAYGVPAQVVSSRKNQPGNQATDPLKGRAAPLRAGRASVIGPKRG